MSAWRFIAVISAVACVAGAAQPAFAQDGPDFRGKTVTIIASFEAGGPYDFYSRLVARFMGPHLPGNPNVIVQNMPGAGGLRGVNYLYNVAARDGTVMGVVSQTVAVGQVLATTPGIQYDARKFNWVGRINSNVEVEHTWYTSGVRSIEDAKKREVIVAGTGPTSSSVVMPRLMNELIGTKFKSTIANPMAVCRWRWRVGTPSRASCMPPTPRDAPSSWPCSTRCAPSPT